MHVLSMPLTHDQFVLQLQKQRKNVALMKAVLSSRVDVNAVDYVRNAAVFSFRGSPMCSAHF